MEIHMTSKLILQPCRLDHGVMTLWLEVGCLCVGGCQFKPTNQNHWNFSDWFLKPVILNPPFRFEIFWNQVWYRTLETEWNQTCQICARVNRYVYASMVYVAALLSPGPRLLRLRGIVSCSQTQPGFGSDHVRLAKGLGGGGRVLGPSIFWLKEHSYKFRHRSFMG